MKPEFQLLNSINVDKQDLLREGLAVKDYIPFFINRSLSYFTDTIFYSNEMNRLWNLDKQMQYDFLRVSVRPRKRFSKWIKEESTDQIDALMRLYNYSYTKAKQAAPLIREEDWVKIFQLLDEGGKNSKNPK